MLQPVFVRSRVSWSLVRLSDRPTALHHLAFLTRLLHGKLFLLVTRIFFIVKNRSVKYKIPAFRILPVGFFDHPARRKLHRCAGFSDLTELLVQ